MTRTKYLFLVPVLLLLFAVFSLQAFADVRSSEERINRAREGRIEGQYIVVLNDSVVDQDAVEEEMVARARGERLDTYRYVLHGFSARLSPEAVLELAEDSRVAFISEDREVSLVRTADERISGRIETVAERVSGPGAESDRNSSAARRGRPAPSEPTPSSSQTLPTGVNRINAENKANKGAGVHVAVIDTGIANHADLDANVAGGKNCLWSGDYKDQNGHGTHVAGTIAALNNTYGVVGVAPEAKLWSVRVLDKNGSGSWSSVICGLDFVAGKGPANGGPISVANMSLGGGGSSDNNCGNSNNDALHKAVCRVRDAGVTLIVAAGNSGANAAQSVPAAYDDAVITVSALADSNGASGGGGPGTSYGADDTFASFSNWGTPVDVGAPGVNIYSTWLSSGYKSISGTSMASPHVAGVAALYKAIDPDISWNDIRSALIGAGELTGQGHTDPDGKHPEPVVRADSL